MLGCENQDNKIKCSGLGDLYQCPLCKWFLPKYVKDTAYGHACSCCDTIPVSNFKKVVGKSTEECSRENKQWLSAQRQMKEDKKKNTLAYKFRSWLYKIIG